jgi:hypothetical protein
MFFLIFSTICLSQLFSRVSHLRCSFFSNEIPRPHGRGYIMTALRALLPHMLDQSHQSAFSRSMDLYPRRRYRPQAGREESSFAIGCVRKIKSSRCSIIAEPYPRRATSRLFQMESHSLSSMISPDVCKSIPSAALNTRFNSKARN